MFSLLVAHIIITACCFWSGFLFYKFFPTKNENRPLIFYPISGLIFLTAITQVIALFLPINIYSKLIILSLLVLLSLYKRENTKFFIAKIKFFPSLVLFFIVWAIILLINAGPIIMDDTESYHIQSIKWIQEYGSVPGLVNLHERFGFNSSWFSSVALFSFLPTTTGGLTVLNSVLSMWLCYWFIAKYNEQKDSNPATAFSILIVFILSLVIWPLLRGNAATANYDFITTCIIVILFTEIFLSEKLSPSIEWIVWPAYLLTVRIINFPFLIVGLAAFLFFIKQKEFKPIFLPVAYCLLLIVPFIIRNVIITGYPFYPSTSLDITNVDWKPDSQMTERLLEYIKYYNRVSTTYLEIEQTKALGSNWVPSWFNYLFLFDKVLVVGGFIGLLLSVIKSFTQKNKAAILLTGVSIIWFMCWFFISPDPRFIYGVLLFGIFLLAYELISLINNIQLKKVSMNILLIAVIAYSSYYFISKSWKQPEYRNWIFPTELPQPPAKEFIINGITFRIPELINNNWNARCYGTDLPCLYKIDPRLRPRGKYIRNGFRLEK
jgi:hypothetical protein